MSERWNIFRGAFASDEGHTKKDDDRRPPPPSGLPGPATAWAPARIPPRRTARRFVLLVLILVLFYLLFNLFHSSITLPRLRPINSDSGPSSDAPFRFPSYHKDDGEGFRDVWPPSPNSRPGQRIEDDKSDSAPDLPLGAPPLRGGAEGGRASRTPLLRFPALSATLDGISGTMGDGKENRNVLFASCSLESAAALLPLACEMARQRLSYVHYALMSRDDMPMQELKRLNGVDDSCGIIFHDARPDHSSESTNARVQRATGNVLNHINSRMHPQVIIIDGGDLEDPAFVRGMRQESARNKLSVIELPENGAHSMGWLARLDSRSLSAWDKVSVEIVVQAPPTGSGSLMHLLKSLGRVDLTPFPTPRLTINLPQQIEKPTERFLRDFSWPPSPPHHASAPLPPQLLSLRRRIPRQNMDQDASVSRFLETAWPGVPEYNHILVLSPQAEVSPQFMHYLKYALLQYRYSATALRNRWDYRLVGISLDFPSTYLNASSAFVPPTSTPSSSPSSPKDSTPFLWQAPNSNAVLITGEKWIELHDLVSSTYRAGRNPSGSNPAGHADRGFVCEEFPAWLEYLAQLCRLRGYFTSYPGLETASGLVTVHQDLAQRPEEFLGNSGSGSGSGMTGSRRQEVTLVPGTSADMLLTLPSGGDLPFLGKMPLLNWRGDEVSLRELDEEAWSYVREFRRTVGRCTDDGDSWDGTVANLFC